MKYFFACMALLFCANSFAQFPEYYADVVYGDVSIRQVNKKVIPLKPRGFIFKGDIIIINEGGRLIIFNKDYRYLELNKKGNYAVSNLLLLTQKRPSSATEKYFSMVLEEIQKPAASHSVDNITRSFGGVSRSKCAMNMFPLPGAFIVNDSAKFSWAKQDTALSYTFILKNADKKYLLQQLVKDTGIIVSKNNLKLSDNTNYYWTVKKTFDPCGEEPENKISWISGDDYQSRIQNLLSAIDKNDTHQYNLDAAQKLLDNHFYDAAGEYLQKAITDNASKK